MTPGHLIRVIRDRDTIEIPAREVQIGDKLISTSGPLDQIKEIAEGLEDSENLIQIYTDSGSFLIESEGSQLVALCASEGDQSTYWLPLLRLLSYGGLPQHLSKGALAVRRWLRNLL